MLVGNFQKLIMLQSETLLVSRVTGPALSDTCSCLEVLGVVQKYLLRTGGNTVDVFARNQRLCKWTNDINEKTAAEFHLDSLDFCRLLVAKKERVDLVLFDPPFSPTQAKRQYEECGLELPKRVAQACGWSKEKDEIKKLMKEGGYFISLGWNTVGMGTGRGFYGVELVVVNHGSGHNDTLVYVEQKFQDRTRKLL